MGDSTGYSSISATGGVPFDPDGTPNSMEMNIITLLGQMLLELTIRAILLPME